MRKTRLIIPALVLAIVTLVIIAGCKKTEAKSDLSGSVKIAGSSTVYPVSVAVAEEFNWPTFS